jgi:hypothetical protein
VLVAAGRPRLVAVCAPRPVPATFAGVLHFFQMSTSQPSPPRFTTRLRVRYAETDASGVVYHGDYLTYCEVVRLELLRALGHPITAIGERGLLLPAWLRDLFGRIPAAAEGAA